MKSIKQTITFIILTSIIGASPLHAMLSQVSRRLSNAVAYRMFNTIARKTAKNNWQRTPQARLPQPSQARACSNTAKNNPQTQSLSSRAPHAGDMHPLTPKGKWHPNNKYLYNNNNYALYENFRNRCRAMNNAKKAAAAIGGPTVLGWLSFKNDTESILKAALPPKIRLKDYIDLLFLSEEQLEELLKDEEMAHVITQVAIKGFNALARNRKGHKILTTIMRHYPDTVKEFTQAAAQGFSTLAKDLEGKEMLQTILLYYPDTAKEFTTPAAQNFSTLAKNGGGGMGIIRKIIYYNPDAAKKFTPLAVQNFNTLTKDVKGNRILKIIMEHNPDAVQLFTQPAAQNFSTLAENTTGRETLEMIIEHNPDAAKEFTQLAIQNFSTLAKDSCGIQTFEMFMKHNPDAAKKFTQSAIQNFSTLAKDSCGIQTFEMFMKHNPDAAKKFTQSAIKNFNTLAKAWHRHHLLANIMKHNPDAAKVFTPLAAQNFDALAYDSDGGDVIEKIIEHNPDAAKKFTQLAVQNFITLATHREGRETLKMIIQLNPGAAKAFTQPAIHIIQEINLSVLKKIIENNPHSVEIKEALESLIFNKNQEASSLDMIIKKVLYNKYFNAQDSFSCLSQTEQHISTNIEPIVNGMSHYFINPDFLNMSTYIIAKEQELKNQDYYTFIHGQRWEYQLAEEWYRFLWELRKQKPIQDYVFPHLKQEETDLDKEQKVREQLLKGKGIDHQRILFTNYALFGNSTKLGSSSAHYFVDNANVGNIHISLEDVFRLHGYLPYYKKYKRKLKRIEREHKKLSKHGNLLLIAVPEDKLKDCVYSCERSLNIQEIGETDDIKIIMDTLRTNQEKLGNSDQVEFCMIMTWDLALNPDSGLKMFSYNAADQEKLTAFNEKANALFEKIKKDIEQDRNNTMN